MTVVAEIVLVVVVLSLLAMPLFRKVDEEYILTQKLSAEEGDQYHQLLARKENLLEAIKDLSFDFETGKLSEEDYNLTKADFELQAIEVIKEVDEMKTKAEAEHARTINSAKNQTVASEKQHGATPEAKVTVKAHAFCPHCGTALRGEGFKFCPSCGKQLSA